MRQRLLILFACILTYISASAVEISEAEAIKKAKALMPSKEFMTDAVFRAKNNLPTRQQSSKQSSFYIINAEDDGFVIVASDDRMPKILAYSEHGSLDLSSAPSNVKWWLDCCELAINDISKQKDITQRYIRKANENNIIAPFLNTNWGQDAPYNNQCPSFGNKCATGCVATAMAQVMNYCKWPENQTEEIPAYSTATNQIFMPSLSSTTFDWDNMQSDDIARLMLYCGQSVQTDYGVEQSGADGSVVPSALTNYFGFGNQIQLVQRSDYDDNDWEDLIYEEIRNKRPVLYSGTSSNNGHMFICHGYNDGLFYINWGWDGDYDGYYNLSILNPNTHNYSNNQTAIIGLQKPSNYNASETDDDIIYYFDEDAHLQYTLYKSRKEAMLGIIYEFYTSDDEFAYATYIDVFSPTYPNISYENVVVPQTITYGGDTYTVTSISYRAFCEEGVKRISLPETIKSIGAEAFKHCMYLTEINIPNSVTEIQSSTFFHCKQLQSIKLPNSIKAIGAYAFSDCESLQKINIPGNCLSVGNNAFKWCKNLKTLIIEDSDNTLNLGYNDEVGFNYYPRTEDQIDLKPHYRGAFSDSKLDSIYIGRNITFPREYNIYVSKGWKTCFPFEQCSEYRVESLSQNYLYSGPKLHSLELGGNVTAIPDSLFMGATILNELLLPEGICSIGTRAFAVRSYGTDSYGSALNQEKLVLPSSLERIGLNAFGKKSQYITHYDTTNVTLRFIISKSILPPEIIQNPFNDCTIYVPAGTGKAYREAWGGKIVDPTDDIVTINVRTPGTLYSRLLAQDIQIEDVCRIKLKGTPNDDDWTIVNSMPFLYDWDLSELNVTEFPKSFFQNNKNLVSLKLPNSLTEICDSAFYGCPYLSDIISCPPACTRIGHYAFYNTAISEMTFSNPVNIGKGAFKDCYYFENVKFSAGSTVEEDAFLGAGLKEAIIEDGVKTIASLSCEKIIFEGLVDSIGNMSATKMYAPDILTWLRLPVQSAPHLYINGEEVTDITIPSEIEYLKEGAFKNCESLNTVVLQNGLTGIGGDAFYGCKNLHTFDFPSTITTIGNGAFTNCSSINEIVLPLKLSKLSSSVFSGCKGISTITFPTALQDIEDYAFSDCSGITKLDFPSSLLTIGGWSFSNCSELTEVDIPESVVTIGNGAFSGCPKINTIVAHWDDPITITEDVFPNVSSDCYLYIPIGTSTKYFNAGWNSLPKIKEAGIMNIISNNGGCIKYDEDIISEGSQSIFFTPYKSFYLSFIPNDGYKLVKLELNGKNVLSEVDEDKLFIEEPEQNFTLSVTFADANIELGDVNGDGIINEKDAKAIMNYILKNVGEDFHDYWSDMNGDNIINITDAILIVRKFLGKNNK